MHFAPLSMCDICVGLCSEDLRSDNLRERSTCGGKHSWRYAGKLSHRYSTKVWLHCIVNCQAHNDILFILH